MSWYLRQKCTREKVEAERNHCVKSVRIRSYSGRYFPAFGLNTERYGVSLCIQSECGKMRTRIAPNMDTSYAANVKYLVSCSNHCLMDYRLKLMVDKPCMKNVKIQIFYGSIFLVFDTCGFLMVSHCTKY